LAAERFELGLMLISAGREAGCEKVLFGVMRRLLLKRLVLKASVHVSWEKQKACHMIAARLKLLRRRKLFFVPLKVDRPDMFKWLIPLNLVSLPVV
jgi:hypothetical protein